MPEERDGDNRRLQVEEDIGMTEVLDPSDAGPVPVKHGKKRMGSEGHRVQDEDREGERKQVLGTRPTAGPAEDGEAKHPAKADPDDLRSPCASSHA